MAPGDHFLEICAIVNSFVISIWISTCGGFEEKYYRTAWRYTVLALKNNFIAYFLLIFTNCVDGKVGLQSMAIFFSY